jgi:hypothetical protein
MGLTIRPSLDIDTTAPEPEESGPGGPDSFAYTA